MVTPKEIVTEDLVYTKKTRGCNYYTIAIDGVVEKDYNRAVLYSTKDVAKAAMKKLRETYPGISLYLMKAYSVIPIGTHYVLR